LPKNSACPHHCDNTHALHTVAGRGKAGTCFWIIDPMVMTMDSFSGDGKTVPGIISLTDLRAYLGHAGGPKSLNVFLMPARFVEYEKFCVKLTVPF
jgi:hypothetical protein